MSESIWLLLTAGAGRGVATPLAADISAGVHGEGVRRVDINGAGAALQHSAIRAVNQAARILYREGYLDRQILVRFRAADIENVHGESAELAFALAMTGAAIERALPPLAATGRLGDGGAIEIVEGIADKLAAAIDVLPQGGHFIFPAAGERDLSPALRRAAADRGIVLVPAHRLEDLLARLGVPITRTWLAEPFRGLEPFTFAHASIFFGRRAEIDELVALLARRPAILVRGPSGAGKSSLVLAGLLPALLRREAGGEGVRWGLLRPRDIVAKPDPERERDSLAQVVAQAWCHDDEGGLGAAAQPPASPMEGDHLATWLREWGATRPILVIDQLEELFDGRLHPATVEALAQFVADATHHGIKLIATITNAALPALAPVPALSACFSIEGQYVLEPRHDAALLEAVIRAPAAAAGLHFATGLEAELLASASHGGADVLPLLELLLTELYERRDRATREMRLADYRTVGGLDGVISARAEAVFHELAPTEREAVALLLWKLNTLAAIETHDYPPAHPIHAVLAAYQAKRLLVRDGGSEGHGAVLRVAHEALLRHWSRAVEQRQADAAQLRLWHDLMREAQQSHRGERALIPSGPQLAAASSLMRDRRTWWTAGDKPVVEYIERSVQQRQRRQFLVAAGAGLPAAAGIAWGGGTLWNAWRALSETHIDFTNLSVPGPGYVVAAEAYLSRQGITVPARSPDTSRIVIKSSLGLYAGRAAEGGKTEHFLTQDVDGTTEPVSFTLAFAKPPRRVGIYRAALWAATESGVTHPGWTAEAIDAAGRVIDRVEEALFGDYKPVPGKLLILDGGPRGPIARVRIVSDYRARNRTGQLVPFAAFRAVLINELILYY
jgi:Novel STAND NTPase 1